MGAPIYESNNEIMKIAKTLLEKRDDIFCDLKKNFWPEMLACGLRVDKPAPKKQKSVLKIEGIRGSKTLLNKDVKYLIHGYASMWDSLSEEKKIAYVANMLIRIEFPTEDELQKLSKKGQDYEWGKLRKPDIQDFRSFLASPGLGIDWAEEETKVSNLIEDKTEF
jgi:hypothetical protein